MKKTIVDYLEQTNLKYKNKIAFEDVKRKSTYNEFVINSKKIGTYLNKKLEKRNIPIAIFLDKSVASLESMMGVIYSGNFYTVLDVKSPKERINTILTTLKPSLIITDSKNISKIEQYGIDKELCLYEEMLEEVVDEKALDNIKNKIIDTDPMYVLFTSGSTGVPKGTVLSHRSVTTYTKWVVETFDINDKTIWGSQTPFYFSMSVTDVFSTMMAGATLEIIPKMYFSFPVKLLEFLNEKHINSIYWVPSALGIVANLKALDEVEIKDVKKVLFAGEVMPTKQLNMWMDKLPNAMFANLFGPTETTDICTYFVVDKRIPNEKSIPIGRACNNCDVIIVKEDGTEAKKGEEGELLVRGSFLASGYYDNPEKTKSVFVQNPLNKNYPEIVYKTGDIVKYNENDELIYLSRKDFQIKHMGYRIELGEIENAINNIDNIVACSGVYDTKNSKIVVFYQGDKVSEEQLIISAKERLPSYMCPNEVIKLDRMPYNANGKIDRVNLKNMLIGE